MKHILEKIKSPAARFVVGCFLIVVVPGTYGLVTDGFGYRGLPSWLAWCVLVIWIYVVTNYIWPKNIKDTNNSETGFE